MMAESEQDRAYRLVLDHLKNEDPTVRSKKEKALMKRMGKSRRFVQARREQLIADAAVVRPDLSAEVVATWVDTVLEVEPLH
jgi:hypothetical protein